MQQSPSYTLRRDTRVTGTVEAIDPPDHRPGVRVRFDRPVNGLNDCYATYAELSPA